MAKYHGKIGYCITAESSTQPGVWEESVIEHDALGEIIRNTHRFNDGQKVIGDLTMSSTFSIVADSFALANFQFARYLTYMGVVWAINSIDPAYPRLNITIGGIYNGPTAGTSRPAEDNL